MRVLRDRYASLSQRERQVMALVVSGLLNKTGRWGTRDQRDYGEGTPRQRDAKDEGRFSCRPGENCRETARRARVDYVATKTIFHDPLIRDDLEFMGSVRPKSYQSLSRYSSGTSSSGTSCVWTSRFLSSSARSTPPTTPASNAFPSSSNSPTLSESALSSSRNPCKSPDCPAERGPVSSSNAALCRAFLRRVPSRCEELAVPSALLALDGAFFLAVSFFEAPLFDTRRVVVTFLLEVRLDFIAFLPFFLVAIFAV